MVDEIGLSLFNDFFLLSHLGISFKWQCFLHQLSLPCYCFTKCGLKRLLLKISDCQPKGYVSLFSPPPLSCVVLELQCMCRRANTDLCVSPWFPEAHLLRQIHRDLSRPSHGLVPCSVLTSAHHKISHVHNTLPNIRTTRDKQHNTRI